HQRLQAAPDPAEQRGLVAARIGGRLRRRRGLLRRAVRGRLGSRGFAALERTAATTTPALARGPLAFGHRRLSRRHFGRDGRSRCVHRDRRRLALDARLARRTRAALATLAAAATAATAAATAALRILGGARLAHFPEDF